MLSKSALFKLYCDTVLLIREAPLEDFNDPTKTCTYFSVKQNALHYQAAKARLLGPGCAFAGWVTSGAHRESFTVDTGKETGTHDMKLDSRTLVKK